MKTRNADSPKPGPGTKKTPPGKKPAVKASAQSSSETPKTASAGVKKATPASKGKQVKTPTSNTAITESKPKPAAEAEKPSDAVTGTPEAKVVSGTKATRKVIVKRIVKKKALVSNKTPKVTEAGKDEIRDSKDKGTVDGVKDSESLKKEETAVDNSEKTMEEVKDDVFAEATVQDVEVAVENVGSSSKIEDSAVTDVEKYSLNLEPSAEKEGEKEKVEELEMGTTDVNVEHLNEHDKMEKVIVEDSEEDEDPEEDLSLEDEKMDEEVGHVVHDELGEEKLAEGNLTDGGEAVEALEEEQAHLNAAAKERKIRKEVEIFVGGLDRNATEDEVKKVFSNAGEVVEVRIHKDHQTNKNKGYAFVRFATKEQAARALAEMRNPVIHGKRCGTSASEDNDTLFLGNICNTWTKEAIRQKLKDYGITNVENITLVSDPQHEGLSRGFTFLEFPCHQDARLAYNRLQKPDAIFGHPDRTAKVAFAEPLREPDPQVLAQVKSVFVDGLPPRWDEDIVRENFKEYGEIERVQLARNMNSAKRRDFGFVDFKTHEAAVACIDGINSKDLSDGNLKVKVRARLSNPLPKTQAVKGGMAGGFRIGHGGGRGFARPNFPHGRALHLHGRGESSRMGYFGNHERENTYSFRGRQNFGRGGRWGSFRGPHPSSDGHHGRHMPVRGQPFPPEEEFGRPFVGRHFDDPYYYDTGAHGVKRPFLDDHDPDYMEPSRSRPRLDYSDPASLPGSRYRGSGSGLYSRDYYGYDYDGGAHSSYGGGRPYGGRYYY